MPVVRDPFGVPHIRAASLEELAQLHGSATAADRTWQLDIAHRRALGSVAALVGPAGLTWDTLARRLDLAGLARRCFANLEPATQAFCGAYASGVTAALRTDTPELTTLDALPLPWEPWTPVAVFLGHNALFGTFPGKLWRQCVLDAFGEAGAALLSAEGAGEDATAPGSNAWGIGGARTASGLPLIGGDPHRIIESPGIYQQVRLEVAVDEAMTADIDVTGFAFVGVPGVQHFAHAGDVAWAITNAMGDAEDLFAEDPAERGEWTARVERIEIRGGDPVDLTVHATPRGPVVHQSGDGSQALSLRTAAGVLESCGLDALLPLLSARTVTDVDRALDHWVLPVNNVVMADTAGRVRYRVAGRVPVRPEAHRRGIVDARLTDADGGWKGWADLPAYDIAADDVVVTANERRGPESTTVGRGFAAPHRARRIRELLAGRRDLSAADCAAIHRDTLLLTAASAQQHLARLDGLGPAAARVRDSITAWDGHMDADSRGAAAFAAWRSALVRRLIAHDVFAPLRDSTAYGVELAPYVSLTHRIALAVPTLLAAEAPFGIDLAADSAAALADTADPPGTWGETHVLDPAHAFEVIGVDLETHPVPLTPPRTALSGDIDTVRCTGSLPGTTDACWRGSVARYVWDLADRAAGGWVVPLGATATGEHALDQLDLWTAGELAPLPGHRIRSTPRELSEESP